MHSRNPLSWVHNRMTLNLLFVLVVLITLVAGYTISQTFARSTGSPASLTINQAFTQASQQEGVPVELLKAICYIDGRVSNNGGEASVDNGYGCMDLAKNQHVDTLDQAANKLGVSVSQLKQNLATNIFGGAFVLRADALQLSSNLPTSLGDWYGAVALYSNVSTRSLALMFADSVYKTIDQGFSITTQNGELVTLAPDAVTPNTATSSSVMHSSAATIPSGCTNDGNVDYPGAIDCILTPPTTYDCNSPQSPSDCNYTSSDRPNSCTVWTNPVVQPCKVDQIVIHDTEGSLASALDEFMCLGNNINGACNQSSVQYIIDTDGKVYQVIRDSDIAYHDGNFWSNMHSIGIEHIGFDATGYQWYTSTEYQASAKLVAFLTQKYNIPVDHSHIVAHGTVPWGLVTQPNHVDPGPYWLWDYYLNLVSQDGGGTYITNSGPPNTITLHPKSDQKPDGSNGTETTANFNFFNLYTGPSTKSGLIPQQGNGTDITDVSFNVEADISYYFVNKAVDAGGTGDTMYEIWYGEEDQVHTASASYFADAKLAWLAVPAGDGVEGTSQGLTHTSTRVTLYSASGSTVSIYGRPVTDSTYIIGGAPSGAVFTTALKVTEDNTSNIWYEINYNHRQAWIPASEIAPIHAN